MAHPLEQPALVLGATGSVGGAIALALAERGHRVRVLARTPAKAARRFDRYANVEIVPGDVQDRAAVVRAAEGCGVIVHGVNYPYHRWVPYMQTATLAVIAAAQSAGALVLFAGNVYGLGAQTGAPLGEDAPNLATTKKGRFRVRLEELLQAATEPAPAPEPPPEAEKPPRPGSKKPAEPPPPPPEPIRVLVLRAGDYFGPTARNGFVDRIFGNAARGRPIQCFGRLDIAHQWAYVPDLARAALDLLDHSARFAPFEVINFAGHVVDSEESFIRLIAREAGRADLKVQRLSWFVLALYGLIAPDVRELMELRYLFDSSVILDDAKLRALLPDFQPTPIEQAVRETLESYRS